MRLRSGFAALAIALPGPHAAAAGEPQPAAFEPEVAAIEPRLIAWRRDLHQHPELGNRETRTAGVIADHLRSLGLKVETGVAHTGVVALLEGGRPGPRLAVRADMDALPVTEAVDLPFKSTATSTFRGETVGVMHACGHDAHVSIQMAAAEILVKRRAQLAGSVLFVFQPAEEGAPEGEEGGAELMLKEGVFDRYRPDAIVGLHVFSFLNTGKIGVRSGPIMAESDRFQIVVHGVQSHGSRPWAGVDPVVVAADIVGALQTIVSRRTDPTRFPAVVSVGAIKGGIRYNIIPDSVEMIGTIRTFDDATRERIFAEVPRIATHLAEAQGATAETKLWRHTGVTRNDPALTARLRPALALAVGADNVVEMPLLTVAEDFSYFADKVPGFYFSVGATPAGRDADAAPGNHSPRFNLDEDALAIGTRALLEVTQQFLEAPPP
jgi:amidohydrolase